MEQVPQFRFYKDYARFADSVTHTSRYFRSSEDDEFLREVTRTIPEHTCQVSKDSVLWRAQVGCEYKKCAELDDFIPIQFGHERMRPPPDWTILGRSVEGRINPKGNPCLYTSTDEYTAIAEVRPPLGCYVSVALLTICRPLQIVNCTADNKIVLHRHELNESEKEAEMWRAMDRAFSQPVVPSVDVADYAPTQVLAEHFRRTGLDGIAYRSRFPKTPDETSFNVALFNCDDVTIEHVEVFEVTDIRIKYSRR